MSQTKVLLVGYNGANNTGAEALLLADIEDVRAVLGPQAVITIPSLNPPNLRRYVKAGSSQRIQTFQQNLSERRAIRYHKRGRARIPGT